MKLLVVDALAIGEKARRELTRDFIGAGPRMVAATARARGHDVTLVRAEDFIAGRCNSGFDACLISGMTMDRPSVLHVARMYKRRAGGPVMVGGPVALEPARLLRDPRVDAVVAGEAERVLWTALDGGRVALDAKGVITRRAFKDPLVFDWPPPSFMERIDPGFDLLERSYDQFWASKVYVEVLRGCSNVTRAKISGSEKIACTGCKQCNQEGPISVGLDCPANQPRGCGFCSTVPVSGPVRSFSIFHVLRQVREAINAGCHRVVLGGSDILEFQRECLLPAGATTPRSPPGPNIDALEALVAALVAFPQVQSGDVQLFIENVKASLCEDRALAMIARIPGVSLSVGIETGTDDHLDRIGKATSIETIKTAIDGFARHGLRFHAYFIHSLPGQARRDAAGAVDLMRWMNRRGVDKITIYKFKPLPCTAFADATEVKAPNSDSLLMVREARRINESRKHDYIGRVVKILLAEHDFRTPGDAVAYLLEGGPKVKIPGAAPLVGDKRVHLARITGVLSDKMTTGELVGEKEGINRSRRADPTRDPAAT